MAGLFFDFVDDSEIWKAPFQFMCGRYILVAPVIEEGATRASVYLPKGDWIDFWSGEKHEGGKWIEIEATLEKIPAFVKEGAFIY